MHTLAPPRLLAFTVLSFSVSAAVHAQVAPPPTSSEWGGVGLLQTPSARMAEEGDISFTASHNSPYSRYNFSMQPFPWLEGTFRYISIANRRYGPEWLSGDQNFKDKSIDVKVRLWQESRLLPEVAFGIRDIGGTGLFSSEYLVASKRLGPIDASLGLATGYIGNRGDLENPLTFIDDRFRTRPSNNRGLNETGQFGIESMFRGPVGVFGGVSYQTPWDSLILKLEYDGNDYKHEPQSASRSNVIEQKTPLNFGLVYRPNANVELTAAWERGDAAMFALTIRGNPGLAHAAPKPLDPPPVKRVQSAGAAVETLAESSTPSNADNAAPHDWEKLSSDLLDNAGFLVQRISRKDKELQITGYQLKYRRPGDSLDRASRILNNSLGSEYSWYTLQTNRLGMPVVDASFSSDAFLRYTEGKIGDEELKRNVELNAPSMEANDGDELFASRNRPYGGGFSVGYRQNLGGPDGFILYQIAANYSGSAFITPNLWLTGTLSQNLVNNYDKFRYDAPSRLPRVRTDLRKYMKASDVTLPNLQLTASRRLGRDTYGLAYAGYLEWMYAGVGGEILYRPIDQSWALGGNVNWVRQRDYDQAFGLRDYQVTTGHATFYYAFDMKQRIVGSLSVGRYLAGDTGATVNIARSFENGVTMGAYATKTNVSSADFGEGSFDKGIYISIPLDNILPRSTNSRTTFTWNPLIRDGGAMLARKYALYSITSERDRTFFYDNMLEE